METTQKDNETISLKRILIGYLKYWKLFVFAGSFSLILAVLYIVLYPTTYEVMSRIKIQEEKDLGSGGAVGLGEAAGLMRSFGLGGGSGTTINIDDEMAALGSNQLLKKVVLKLGLDVSYAKPFSFEKLYTNSPVIVTPDSLMRQTLDEAFAFRLKINDDGSVKIKMDKGGEVYKFQSMPVQLYLDAGTVDIMYRNEDIYSNSLTLDINVFPAGWIAEDLADMLMIEEFSTTSNTLEMTYLDHNKGRGKDLLNCLMAEFNKGSDEVKRTEGQQSLSFLEARVDSVVSQLSELERTIEQYKLRNNIMSVEFDVQFYAEAVKTFREKIIELEAQGHIINLLDDYVNDPKNKYRLIPFILSMGSGEAAEPITIYNQAVIERDRIQKAAKSSNPLSELADNQIDKLRESVVVSIENSRTSMNYVLADLKSQEKAILDKMKNVPTYEREYLDLRRQQEILQGVYLVLLQKKEEIALSLGKERDKGFVVDEAFVKYAPVAPRKLYAAIFIFLFTIIIPICYLFCKEQALNLIAEYRRSK